MREHFISAFKFILPVSLLFLLFGFTSGDIKNKKVCFSRACINVEVVDNDAQRQKGLMFRKSLAWDSGMLFVFERQERQFFYMKNMNFPLDIIWIDSGKKIVGIKKNFKAPAANEKDPKAYAARSPALYVIEVNSGFCDKYGIGTGEVVSF